VKLWRLLRRSPRPPRTVGRPPGSGRWRDAADFELAVRTAAESLAQKGRAPTQEAVCRILFCRARTLRRWCRDYGVDWLELRKRSLSKRP
jgi:hypothetical protein